MHSAYTWYRMSMTILTVFLVNGKIRYQTFMHPINLDRLKYILLKQGFQNVVCFNKGEVTTEEL
jgi:hypothetical protein